MKAVLLTGAETDLDSLQGAWVSVCGRRSALLLIAGSHYFVRFKDGPTYVGTLTVDERAMPKTMDMTIEQGPEKHVGKTAMCIYQLDEDSLRWCPADPGTKDRLKAFPSAEDERHLCMIFEREPS